MGRKRKEYTEGEEGAETTDTKEEKQPAVTTCEVTEENPSGIEAVSDEHAMKIGQLRGDGGPGAAGCTVAGPVVHAATEGGTKPLPIPEAQQVEQQEPEPEPEAEVKTEEVAYA